MLVRTFPYISRSFHPDYLLKNLPITPIPTLERARDIALAEGLHYVYIGNVPGHPAENTYCPQCRRMLVERVGLEIRQMLIHKASAHSASTRFQSLARLMQKNRICALNRKTRFGRYVDVALLIELQAIVTHQDVHGADQQKVRAAGVAGSFYPSDPAALTAMIDGMLAMPQPPQSNGPILAVVAPHAGYQYSGPVAAFTYAALKGHKYSRVVVIAPSHFEGFDFHVGLRW